MTTVATRAGRLAATAATATLLITAAAGLTAQAASAAPAHAAQASGYSGPHFANPQGAMRYLATAYNHWNTTDLHHVTTPASFRELRTMRAEAVNLRLVSCSRLRDGSYLCHFTHDYPAILHRPGHGASEMIAAPARNPGWYMYALLGCG